MTAAGGTEYGSTSTRERPHEEAYGEELRVLVVDDEHTIREGCAAILLENGFEVTLTGRGEEAKELLERQSFEIVLLDVYMRGVPGLELLRTCLERSPDTLVIMMTGNPSVESSMESLRQGAWDYLVKPFSATQLEILVGRAAHALRVAKETASLRRELPDGLGPAVPVLGTSPALEAVLDRARKVAPTDASVFITGESGTGKELIARFLHQQSRRSSRSLVPVHCAALPEDLLECEIFGRTEDPVSGRSGLLEEAHGGTLFLDEPAELPQTVQARLLRTVQGGVHRVGSSIANTVVDLRLIAATNRDPREALEQGRLRRDLYHRLHVVPIHLPPLRERLSDIPDLARHFLHRFWSRHRPCESMPVLGEAALSELRSRPWHGNVRELKNVMEQAAVLLEPGGEVVPEDLPHLDETPPFEPPTGPGEPPAPFRDTDFHTARKRLVAEFERRYVASLVRNTDGNMTEAARRAGMDRKTLFRLRRKHGIHDKDLRDVDPTAR